MTEGEKAYQKHLEVAYRLQQEGNSLGALVSFRQALQLVPPGDFALKGIESQIQQLEKSINYSTLGETSEPTANRASSSGANSTKSAPPVPVKKWKPIDGGSRNSMIKGLAITFAVVAVIVFILVLTSGDVIDSTRNNIVTFSGNLGIQLAGAGLTSFLVGCIQVWIFKARIRSNRRFVYILTTTLGGMLGGLIGSNFITESSFANGFLVGGIIGLIAGAVGSVVQTTFMRSQNTGMKWFGWNSVSWAVIWGIGWGVSWVVLPPMGMAVGSAVILILSGLSLSLFLFKFPEIEF